MTKGHHPPETPRPRQPRVPGRPAPGVQGTTSGARLVLHEAHYVSDLTTTQIPRGVPDRWKIHPSRCVEPRSKRRTRSHPQ